MMITLHSDEYATAIATAQVDLESDMILRKSDHSTTRDVIEMNDADAMIYLASDSLFIVESCYGNYDEFATFSEAVEFIRAKKYVDE